MRLDHSHTAGGNTKRYSHSRKEYGSFLQKSMCNLLYVLLPHDSAIALRMGAEVGRKEIVMGMFTLVIVLMV